MKVTEITTKHFFKYEFNHVCCLAGLHPMDLVPSNLANLHPCKNGDRNEVFGEAINYAYCVALALNACDDSNKKPYRTILIDYFFKLQSDHKIMAGIGYSSAQYYRFKREARHEFADWFVYYQCKMKFDEAVKLVD